jgi:hypothetical protein
MVENGMEAPADAAVPGLTGAFARDRFRPLAVDSVAMLLAMSGTLTMAIGIIDHIFRVRSGLDITSAMSLVFSSIGLFCLFIAFYKGASWEYTPAFTLIAGASGFYYAIVMYAFPASRLPFYALLCIFQMLAARSVIGGANGSRLLAVGAATLGVPTLPLSFVLLWLLHRKDVLHYFKTGVDSRRLLRESREFKALAARPFNRREWQEAYRLYESAVIRYAAARQAAEQLGDAFVAETAASEQALARKGSADSQSFYWAEQDAATRKRIAEEEAVYQQKAAEERERLEEQRITTLIDQAARFEKAARYLDAVKAYEEANLAEDAGRVKAEAREAARRMESARRWEEAAGLYESLGLWEEAGRARRDGHVAPPMPAAPAECAALDILRDYDHYQGFVRTKVALRNTGRAIIADARLRMDFDPDSLRLDHSEPAMNIAGTEVLLGNVLPGQRKSLSLYFDPQVCGASPLDGMVTFRDSAGALCSVPFKRLTIEVRCPLLFTPEQANTALVRNLMQESLMNRDLKLYALPAELERSRAFCIAKEAITALDVRLVSEHARAGNPEAWFYGQVKNTDERIVLRAAVLPDSVELFVAADSRTAITGLLAELGRAFTRRMREVGYSTVQITNIEIRDSVINRSTLFLDGAEGSVAIADSVLSNTTMGNGGGGRWPPGAGPGG